MKCLHLQLTMLKNRIRKAVPFAVMKTHRGMIVLKRETSKMKTLKIKHLTAKISKGIPMKTLKKILTKALKNRIQMRTLKENS